MIGNLSPQSHEGTKKVAIKRRTSKGTGPYFVIGDSLFDIRYSTGVSGCVHSWHFYRLLKAVGSASMMSVAMRLVWPVLSAARSPAEPWR